MFCLTFVGPRFPKISPFLPFISKYTTKTTTIIGPNVVCVDYWFCSFFKSLLKKIKSITVREFDRGSIKNICQRDLTIAHRLTCAVKYVNNLH